MDSTRSLRNRLTTVLTLLLVAVVFTAPALGAVVFFDGFEDQPADTGVPDGWTLDNGASTDFAVQTGTVYNGSQALEIHDVDTTSGNPTIKQSVFNADTPGTTSFVFYTDNSGSFSFRLLHEDGSALFNWGSGLTDHIEYEGEKLTGDLAFSHWYYVELRDTGVGGDGNTTVYVKNTTSGNVLANESVSDGLDGVTGFQMSENGDVAAMYIDDVSFDEYDVYEISGVIQDTKNNDLSGVTVNATNESGTQIASDTTNNIGEYNLTVENGTYNVTASKTGYLAETQEVTVDGSDETVDFELAEFNASLELDHKTFLEHGEDSPYTVVVEIDGDRKNVTANSTVTSNNTSVVTVNSNTLELEATSDVSVNQRTFIEAEYTEGGNTYVATRNVTVANVTVANLGILPTGARLAASLGANSDVDPEANTLNVILVATIIGAAVALVSTSFAGLGVMPVVMVAGWLGGFVGDGILIVSVLMALFIGLNMAGNIDYQMRQ